MNENEIGKIVVDAAIAVVAHLPEAHADESGIPLELRGSTNEGWHHSYRQRRPRIEESLAILASWRE